MSTPAPVQPPAKTPTPAPAPTPAAPPRLPHKLLVANRGEIAVRIIRTARELGIKTVLGYADQDVNTLGAELADEAYALGGDTAAQTYLNRAALLRVAARSGADALHPGYGFLSENADFATAVAAAGITWVGPSGRVIAALGDKIQARRYARAGGVNMIPGVTATLDDPVHGRDVIEGFVAEHGYPILVKRADGGGGRGITRIDSPADLDEFFTNHRDDEAGLRLSFVEKLMRHCRHVETQCLRDSFGTFAIASTRDCSVQRRNQKLIEEAPAPFLPEATRAQLYAWSRTLFEATDYVGVGTCEFLVDPAGTPYFLEVNPRLQVEHTVSEEVTGTDLVAEQLRIAAGMPITPYLATSPAPHGAAIEIRITSEDPAHGLVPVTGRVRRVDWPGGPGVRVDSYLRPGDQIGGAFDSMIAKITVSAPDRTAAIVRLRRVLDECRIDGVPTCIPLLRRVITDPAFTALPGGGGDEDEDGRGGEQKAASADNFRVHTKWLDDEGVLAQVARALRDHDAAPSASFPTSVRPADDRPSAPTRAAVIEIDGRRVSLKLPAELLAPAAPSAPAPGTDAAAPQPLRMQPLLRRHNDASSQTAAGPAGATGADAVAPMQATVVHLAVAVGQQVKAGQLIAVIEAMKMESYVHAPQAGVVRALPVQPGDAVRAGQVLAVIKATEGDAPAPAPARPRKNEGDER